MKKSFSLAEARVLALCTLGVGYFFGCAFPFIGPAGPGLRIPGWVVSVACWCVIASGAVAVLLGAAWAVAEAGWRIAQYTKISEAVLRGLVGRARAEAEKRDAA